MSVNQFSTFYVNKNLYGIKVDKVQEITKAMSITRVPLSPKYIHGLINLRGQIATAVDLKELFVLPSSSQKEDYINVVCRIKGILISFMVDEISDVIEVEDEFYEETPENIDTNVSQFMDGVYKLKEQLVSILNVDKIMDYINNKDV